MASRIQLLGTGTCQLQEHRLASSVLVELEEDCEPGLRLVYDFGRGIAGRLAALGLLRIPRQSDQLFRSKATTHCGAKRPAIPIEADQ